MSAKTQTWVRRYLERDFAPIAVPPGAKNPNRPGWQDERVGLEDVPRVFDNGQNVGVLNGQPSGWKVCADLDVSEALPIAGRFLLPTLTSGRESRPHSHWWLISPGAKTEKFKDVDGKMLVELRSTGCQTIVAPSTHPSGDRYVWHGESGLKMAHIGAAELKARLRELATAVLIARHLPKLRDESTGEGGGRHDYAMALAGFLLRSGRLDEPLVLKILKAAWDAKGWPDERSKREAHHDLEGIVRDTAENLAAGEPVVGGPTLEELRPGVVRLLYKWWGWERKAQEQEAAPAEKEDRRNQADRLIGYALEDAQALFVDQHGAPHALVDGEPLPLNSRCYSWPRRLMWDQEERAVNGEYLKTAAGTLSAHAEFSGDVRPPPVVRWVLERRETTERSGVSEEDALRRTREEIAQLEAERVRLSTDVMEGRPEALEEDERLRQRIVELGHWLSEAEKEGGGRRGMNEGPRPPQPPPVPPDACGGGA